MKIVKSIKNFGLLIGFTTAIENETKEQIGGFLGMLLATSGPSLLGNIF